MAGDAKLPAGYESGDDVGREGPSRFYLLVPVILILLPLLIEFACMVNAIVCLKHVAAEAGEAAVAGAAPSVIEARIDACRGGVDGRFVDCTALCSQWDPATNAWSAWRTLQMAAGGNDARPGDRIKLRLTYDYTLVLGDLLAPLFGADQDGIVDLEAVVEFARK